MRTLSENEVTRVLMHMGYKPSQLATHNDIVQHAMNKGFVFIYNRNEPCRFEHDFEVDWLN